MDAMRGATTVVLVALALVVLIPEVAAATTNTTTRQPKRWTVGDRSFWAPNVNYTIWAQAKHFYNGDWLYFVYDRNQQSILEVNETNYETCNENNFIHNWTRGSGRDVVPLNITKRYYFISGHGFCFSGMKLTVNVENPPPPPTASPIESGSPFFSIHQGQIVLPVVFALGVMWDALLHFW